MIDLIRSRANLLSQVREFFDLRGFAEVQPPCLSRDCVIDAYLDPIVVAGGQVGSAGGAETFCLQTSPESAMKRMLAAGAPSIYSVGPVFRAAEAGDLHNVEFTMLEWYEVGGDVETGIALLGAIVCEVLNRPAFETITYRELFLSHAGFDPLDCSIETIRQQAATVDAKLADALADDRDSLLDVVLSNLIQPKIGFELPTVVRDYPISQAALAKPSPADERCASRFEIFVDGIELANGYDELLCAETMRLRAELNNARRVARGATPLTVKSTLWNAMVSGLPACAGVALGLDRLQMIRDHKSTIGEVIPFTIDQA